MDAIEFSKQPKGIIWRMEPGELHNIIEESADEIERLRSELAATIKAKRENDERFMLERDEARSQFQKGNEALLMSAVRMAIMRECLVVALPTLPSYMGQSESKEHPCPRRKTDVVLALKPDKIEQLFLDLMTASQKLRHGVGAIPTVLEAVSALENL